MGMSRSDGLSGRTDSCAGRRVPSRYSLDLRDYRLPNTDPLGLRGHLFYGVTSKGLHTHLSMLNSRTDLAQSVQKISHINYHLSTWFRRRRPTKPFSLGSYPDSIKTHQILALSSWFLPVFCLPCFWVHVLIFLYIPTRSTLTWKNIVIDKQIQRLPFILRWSWKINRWDRPRPHNLHAAPWISYQPIYHLLDTSKRRRITRKHENCFVVVFAVAIIVGLRTSASRSVSLSEPPI